MTLPKFDAKSLDSLLKWASTTIGAIALVVVLIVYFDNKNDRAQTKAALAPAADNAASAMTSVFEVTLNAHTRQTASDQRALLEQLEVIEGIARDTLQEQKTSNALTRQRFAFEKCLVDAGDNDKRRALCTAGSSR